jgi:hypothetical protein
MLRRILFVFLSVPIFGCAQNWQSVGVFNAAPKALYIDSVDNLLYAGSYFTSINGEQRWGVASWDNSEWDSLGLGINNDTVSNSPGPVNGFLRDGNYIYVVGAIKRAGTINTNGIARWDGTNWDSVPGCRIPDYESVTDIIQYNGDIYICGGFDSVGGLPLHGLAKWNGISWQAVANNYDFTTQGYLNRLIFYHGRLYVAGNFPDPNGNTCRLARWDGWNWHFMTNDIQGSIAGIYDMVVYQDRLYVGGMFFQAGGNVANSLQSWNDTTWNAVGGSVQILTNSYPTIFDMTVDNGKLYCVGNFEMIGGVPTNSIAIWDGEDWCGLGSTFDMGGLRQIAFYQDTMYVAGGFWSIDGDSIRFMAKWIGGNNVDTCGHLTIGIQENRSDYYLLSYPNPANTELTFQFSSSIQKSVLLYDSFGRLVLTEQTSSSQHVLNVESFAEGIYFYSIIEDGELKANGKFLVVH